MAISVSYIHLMCIFGRDFKMASSPAFSVLPCIRSLTDAVPFFISLTAAYTSLGITWCFSFRSLWIMELFSLSHDSA